jgi:glycosyltransferase involved in cell wall biosynthesis
MEKNRDKYDLIIDTSSNMPTGADIVYVHYPALLGTTSKSGLYWRIYDKLVQHMSKRLLGKPKLVLCNSTWTVEKFKSVYKGDLNVNVLHPPVSVEYYGEVSGNTKRENIVVTVSRFTPVKNLERIVDVAKALGEFKFIIAGSKAKYSEPVIDKINAKIKEFRVNNVELLTDISRSELRNVLGTAKYYLHPPFAEHFGIAVVEAMSAGLVPIVYRDGGVWYDVVSRVSVMLAYSDISEVPSVIRKLKENMDLYVKLRERSIEISKLFSYENFKKKLLRYIEGF